MRSTIPIPGNPWPHDNMIRVEDDPHALLELLWVRDVYGLRPPGDVPPPLAEPPATRLLAPEAAVWSIARSELWPDAVTHLTDLDPEELHAAIQAAALGPAEQLALFERLAGPTWRDRFVADASDASFSEWCSRHVQALIAGHRAPLNEHPERRALDALILAWRAGLAKVIEIPCRGEFTRVAGPSALLLTAETRADPERYAEALAMFATHA